MAQFLTFVIPSNSGLGTFRVRGNFDKLYGFRLTQGPSSHPLFGLWGVGYHGDEFIFDINEVRTNHRVVLKWADPGDNQVSYQNQGLTVVDMESSDTEIFVAFTDELHQGKPLSSQRTNGFVTV